MSDPSHRPDGEDAPASAEGERVATDSHVAPRRVLGPAPAVTQPPPFMSMGHTGLLVAAGALPFSEGPEAVARTVCEALRDTLPSVAVGAIVRTTDGPRVVTALSSEASSVVLQIDPGGEGPPRRMFPTLIDEWILPLGGRGSLHVGDLRTAHDHARGALLSDLAERGALVLTAALSGTAILTTERDDNAQIRALQARVIQGEKLASVGQIAAKVVHELNNPLTAIVTYASYLTRKLDRVGLDPADIERLRRIGESADRILRFSRDLTAFARPDEETMGPIAMQEVVDRAVIFCEHLVTGSGIRMTTHHDPDVPALLGLRGQLTQVFVNLVTNACHAVEDAGRGDTGTVEVRTAFIDAPSGGNSDERPRVQVVIADNGLGVSPENVVRIFDPFFTTKGAGRGTGLGLSIVRSIVDQHGGRVWVKSVAGSGTSFVVELPVLR